eukprot:160802-Chlamydomonas_euryale.AAC.1
MEEARRRGARPADGRIKACKQARHGLTPTPQQLHKNVVRAWGASRLRRLHRRLDLRHGDHRPTCLCCCFRGNASAMGGYCRQDVLARLRRGVCVCVCGITTLDGSASAS